MTNTTVGMANPGALCRLVAQAVSAIGGATVDQLAPSFPGYSRPQLHKALMNARTRGWIEIGAKGPNLRTGRGRRPGVWVASEKKVPDAPPPPPRNIRTRPPGSVWELGHGLQIAGDWPPPFDGGRVYISPEDNNEE